MAQVIKDKPQRYKLTLSKLDFVSLVDDPAQPNATTLLIKGKDGVHAVAKFAGADEELGLAWFWAFTSTEKSGAPHYDHHGDQVAADTEMVRAVLDYMKRGGAVDEMHDYESTEGRVVFAMPVTDEVAKLAGISQTGLLVTIKCTAEQIAKLKDGTYTGVSIAGLGTREAVEACKSIGARAVRKTVSLFTDEVDGHQHQIDIGDDGYTWCSYATSAGADGSHSHAIARDENGAIVILADSGHTHQLADGQPAVIVVPEGAVVVTEVAMRRLPIVARPTTTATPAQSRASGSPRSATAPTVNSHTEKSTMKTAEEKLADLEKSHADTTKRLERAERIAKMSGAHKTHFDTLTGEEADTFLAKSDVERSQTLEALEKADPIEFSLDGVAYRKSTQGYPLAKRLLAEVEKNEALDIEKAATSMLGGASDPEKIVAKAIRSIAKKEDREAAEKLVKGLVNTSRINKAAQGSDAGAAPGSDAGTPLQALTKGLVEFCKAEKIDERSMWTVGLPKFEQTEKGRDLKTSYDESLAG